MFKDMPIKMKLISSFSLIVILIATLGFYSNSSIDKSNKGFVKYDTSAHESLLIQNIEIKILRIRNIVNKYLREPSQEAIKEFNKLIEEEMRQLKK